MNEQIKVVGEYFGKEKGEWMICDICGKKGECTTFFVFGIETMACETCRGGK